MTFWGKEILKVWKCYYILGMKLVLVDDSMLKRARRLMRRSGKRLTVRNGCVYTIESKAIVQPRTERQLRNWALFTLANRLTDRDLRDNGRKRYWKRRARLEGYKTARGCAKAYYVRMVRSGKMGEKDLKDGLRIDGTSGCSCMVWKVDARLRRKNSVGMRVLWPGDI